MQQKLKEWVKADEIQKFGCWSGTDLYWISTPRKLVAVEQCQIFLEEKVTGLKQTKILFFLIHLPTKGTILYTSRKVSWIFTINKQNMSQWNIYS
jgi:hypothetical protein